MCKMKLTPEQGMFALIIGDATHDAHRLIVAGLLNHDELTLQAGLTQATRIIGEAATLRGLTIIISQLMDQGKFYFVNPDTGEPSPLL